MSDQEKREGAEEDTEGQLIRRKLDEEDSEGQVLQRPKLDEGDNLAL